MQQGQLQAVYCQLLADNAPITLAKQFVKSDAKLLTIMHVKNTNIDNKLKHVHLALMAQHQLNSRTPTRQHMLATLLQHPLPVRMVQRYRQCTV
jgi:predicted component of type VI protein secretion system